MFTRHVAYYHATYQTTGGCSRPFLISPTTRDRLRDWWIDHCLQEALEWQKQDQQAVKLEIKYPIKFTDVHDLDSTDNAKPLAHLIEPKIGTGLPALGVPSWSPDCYCVLCENCGLTPVYLQYHRCGF
jgi:hypothetical protein